MDVSTSIRKLRESKDLTQEQFGKIAGVSAMAVSQWENGRAVPRMGAIQKLSDFFNVPKSTIMGDEDKNHTVPVLTLDWEERSLIEMYRAMDDVHRKQLMDLAGSLVTASKSNADGAREDVERAGIVVK